jgi:hypothetical protein
MVMMTLRMVVEATVMVIMTMTMTVMKLTEWTMGETVMVVVPAKAG